MSDDRQDPHLTATGSAVEEESLRELLESAGRRPAVPAEDLAAIKAAARSQWEELVEAGRTRRTRIRRFVPMALAASLLLAVAVRWLWRAPEPPPVSGPVATVQLVHGPARLEAPVRREVTVGEALESGAVLTTEEGASRGLVALRLAGGESVRLDAGTKVRLVSGRRLELAAGAVYVDSGGPARPGSLQVTTPFGTVHEAGTQFEVRLDSERELALRVRVREGAVALVRRGGSDSVTRGGELRLSRDGSVSRGTIELQGPAWSWVLAAAPSLDIEGLRLSEYLAWVSRETAWRLRYEDDALVRLAVEIRLHGTIEGLAPDESLRAILPGSGLAYRVEGETLFVTRFGAR